MLERVSLQEYKLSKRLGYWDKNFTKNELLCNKETSNKLKVVSTTFLLVCFVWLKQSTCETRKNTFYFTLKALLVFEIINF